MTRITRAVLAAMILIGMGSAQAAPTPHQNGFFASAKWRVLGSYPEEFWSQSIGPYQTHGECYTAWMTMTTTPYENLALESVVPCYYAPTHSAYLLPAALEVNDDSDDEDEGPKPFRNAEELIQYVEQVRELRRQFQIDAYESAVQELR